MELGSIVKYNNKKYVITGFKNWEDASSCSYDREYYLLPLEDVINKSELEENEGIKVIVRGNPKPFPLEKITDEAPFEFKRKVIYTIRRKEAKTNVVYE